MGVDLRSDNFRLVRAAWTAMDQTYGTVRPGFALQPIDNSGRGFAQPWSTPEGFSVRHVFEDPGTNFKLTLYRNDATNEVLVVPLGTNGPSDWKGWSSNLRDMGLSQWLFGGYGDDGAPNDRGPQAVGLGYGTVLEGTYGLFYVPGSGALGALGNGAIARAAPVILDLDGNGVKLGPPPIQVIYFDAAGDGLPRRMQGWVDSGDGILTMDLNRDGEIVSLAEMAFTRYMAGAQTDLEGLRAFDVNADLVLDENDPVWSALSVWQDANRNGLTDLGELRLLTAEGIRSLSLLSDGKVRTEGANIVHGETSFERTDGSKGIAADVSLAYDNPPAVGNPPAWVPPAWVEPGPALILQILTDMATQLSPPGAALVSVVPEPIPITPGMIEESPFG